jgi:hypothetical protein
MNNTYTRKEEICPLINQMCNCDDKNCNRCVGEETQYEEEKARQDAEMQEVFNTP